MRPFETPQPENAAEKERSVEQDKKMRFSSELIKRPILDGEPGYDKIFLMGNVVKNDGEWIIDIQSDTPTVVLNDKVKQEFDLKDSPLVSEARDKKADNLTLISGGAFLWLNRGKKSELVLVRRDAGAPVDAGYLTGPAGRCGEAPSVTGIHETNEELIVVKANIRGKERFKLLGFYNNESEREATVHQKLRQVKIIHDYLISQGRETDAALLRMIRGEDDIETLSISKSKRHIKNGDRVVTRVDGQVVDVLENSVVFLDEKVNTLEMREIIDVTLPKGTEIAAILDGEVFGREIVRASSLDQIEQEQKVAALQNYYERIKSGTL